MYAFIYLVIYLINIYGCVWPHVHLENKLLIALFNFYICFYYKMYFI